MTPEHSEMVQRLLQQSADERAAFEHDAWVWAKGPSYSLVRPQLWEKSRYHARLAEISEAHNREVHATLALVWAMHAQATI